MFDYGIRSTVRAMVGSFLIVLAVTAALVLYFERDVQAQTLKTAIGIQGPAGPAGADGAAGSSGVVTRMTSLQGK